MKFIYDFRGKEISTVSKSSEGDSQGVIEQPPPKKEPGTTKNVSFKNHTDSSPVSNYKSHPESAPPRHVEQPALARNQTEPSNAFRGHAEVLSSNGTRPVLEKDQLAKSPYGWRQEVRFD